MSMTETLDVIGRRFSCRTFQDTPVPADLLRTIAEAGVRAPSARNRQPWMLTVISEKADVDEIGIAGLERLKVTDEPAYTRVMGRGGLLLYNAPTMIIISIEDIPGSFPPSLDAGIVASHVVLAATSLGVDSCIVAMPKVAFDEHGEGTLNAKYIPEGLDYAVGVLLGYSDTPGVPHETNRSKIIYM